MIALLLEQELSKKQILELYLNRIYLSGGVYGVETMSQNLYGKPASKLTLRRGGADRRADPRAVGAVAVVQPRRRARSQPRRAAADARGRVHHRRAGEGGARRRGRGSARIPAPPRRGSATRRNSCASSSAIASAATIRPTGRSGRRSCRSCRRRPSARSRAGCAGSATPSCRRRWSRSIRRRATCWRWSAAANFRESQFNRAWRSRRQPGSAFKPFLYAAALAKGYSPVSVLDGLTLDRAAGARRVGAAQRQAAKRRRR